MAVNASQSKNLNIDVKQAKQELLLKKQSLQSQIVNDVDSVHQKNQKMADESGKRLSRLQRSRYIREKQSSDLQTKIETERRQAEEELMAYERERNELRRRYESDKKASENAANANMTAAHIYELWECRCDIYTLFVLYALYSLVQHLLNDCGKICLCLRILCSKVSHNFW